MKTSSRPIGMLACALGGEGGAVLSRWLVDVARAAGYGVQSTSIPGVAQRTGATTYYLEFAPLPDERLGGRRPVFSLYPVPGQLDLLVSSELLETVRQASVGMIAPACTRVLSSCSRTLTTAERMQMGDGRVDDARLLEVLRATALEYHLLDMARITRETDTLVSAVMLGAVAASGVLPFARAAYEAAVRDSGRGAQASLRGFAAGYEQVAQSRARAPAQRVAPNPVAAGARLPPQEFAGRFPASVQAVAALGYARVVEYQDKAYGEQYLGRLERVLQAERAIDPAAAHSFATTREAARWLALWMAFDDIVRVAQLKNRSTRFARIAAEVGARAQDVVKVYDYLKPGVPEFASLLPGAVARRLQRWDARRWQRGRAPFALELVLGSHTLGGALALRCLSAMKWLRPFGARYAQEQSMIERWLSTIVDLTHSHWRLGHEVALCGRLVKGYGATHDRARENLLHVLDQLARRTEFVSADDRALAIAQARDAALADDAGVALDQALAHHGAAPRPPPVRPVRFVPRAARSAMRQQEAAR